MLKEERNGPAAKFDDDQIGILDTVKGAPK